MTEKYNLNIHPYVRLLVIILTLIAIIIPHKSEFEIIFFVFFIVPLYVINHRIKQLINFTLIVAFPIFLSMALFFYIAPQSGYNSWGDILERFFKLIVTASMFQFIFLIPFQKLYPTLKTWKFSTELIILIVGSISILEEMKRRAEKIVASRLARGYTKKRNIINLASHLPHVLNPLLVGVLRTSIERSDNWEQKNILGLIECIKIDRMIYSWSYNMILVTISIVYLSLSLIY